MVGTKTKILNNRRRGDVIPLRLRLHSKAAHPACVNALYQWLLKGRSWPITALQPRLQVQPQQSMKVAHKIPKIRQQIERHAKPQ